MKGLYIGVQAVLALYAQWVFDSEMEVEGATPNLSGLVVDSGEGLSHVIPVADGYVISSCIQVRLGHFFQAAFSGLQKGLLDSEISNDSARSSFVQEPAAFNRRTLGLSGMQGSIMS